MALLRRNGNEVPRGGILPEPNLAVELDVQWCLLVWCSASRSIAPNAVEIDPDDASNSNQPKSMRSPYTFE